MTPRILHFISLALATGLGVAYLTPFAKATLASAVTAVIYYVLARDYGEISLNAILLAATVIVFFIGVAVSARVKSDDDPDPSKVVIDEVAGQLTALMVLAPVEWWSVLAAFLLFRIFDVWKPLGIRRLEEIGGGWGIMLDDLGRWRTGGDRDQRCGADRQLRHLRILSGSTFSYVSRAAVLGDVVAFAFGALC